MTAITGINNNAQNAWTDKSGTRTAAADDAALFRLAQQDATDEDKLATQQKMAEPAMASMQPSSTGYSSSTVSLSDGVAEDTVGTKDQASIQRYDLQQPAQQVLKQYEQVGAGNSSGSATGSSISKVA